MILKFHYSLFHVLAFDADVGRTEPGHKGWLMLYLLGVDTITWQHSLVHTLWLSGGIIVWETQNIPCVLKSSSMGHIVQRIYEPIIQSS